MLDSMQKAALALAVMSFGQLTVQGQTPPSGPVEILRLVPQPPDNSQPPASGPSAIDPNEIPTVDSPPRVPPTPAPTNVRYPMRDAWGRRFFPPNSPEPWERAQHIRAQQPEPWERAQHIRAQQAEIFARLRTAVCLCPSVDQCPGT